MLGLFTLVLTWCGLQNPNQDNLNLTWDVWIANPASVYCEENWGTLELIFDNWESYGICHFENGERCEEREYYRKECFPVWKKTWANNINIDDFESCIQAWNIVMESYPRQCKTQDWKIFVEDIEKNQENTEETDTETEKNKTTETIDNNLVACTQDAKECPDWSRVSRVAPNCEFAPCPSEKSNETINETITDIFEDHKNKDSYTSEWLTEDDIDLMEEIIEKLK